MLKRLKETTFTIAKEIMLKEIETSKIPKESIIRLAGNTDYSRAMQIVSIIESMKETIKIYEVDLITSNIFTACMECIGYEFASPKHHFINWMLDDSLREMLNFANEYSNHFCLDFTSNGHYREYPIKILNKVNISHSIYNKATDWTINDYKNKMNEFFELYENFKQLVQNIKTEIDII